MTKRANSSRERILSTAEAIILEQGFAGTTIDDILNKAAITKGGFFYHFNGKAELATALVERYIKMDTIIFEEMGERANSLSEDPLQQTLIFLNLVSEMVVGMTKTHPGCLVAGFVYEMQQFDENVRDLMKEGLIGWRDMIEERLKKIIEKYPPKIDVSTASLADMFSSSLEGGIILAKVYNDNQTLVDQVQAYRTHLRLVFGDL